MNDRARRRSASAVRRATLVTMPLLGAVLATGCSKRAQLEAVARDWMETIRASQIIPVYPMTEDLQPGDVFLVQVPIDQQQKEWKRGDYLPLDNHLARIDPAQYVAFYDHSFLDAGDVTLPKQWMRGKDGAWTDAPGASFPSYSFTVKRGAGVNLAVPVSSVPVGLSLMGTDMATGTVIIRNARTLGVDIASMQDQLDTWAAGHRALLANFAPPEGEPPRNFLRVVTRIYLTGRLDVTLQNAQSFAGGADVGQPRPVDLLFATPPPPPAAGAGSGSGTGAGAASAEGGGAEGAAGGADAGSRPTLDDYDRNLAKLNGSLAAEKATRMVDGVEQLIPGGSVRVTAAAGRSISLAETFDPPLVLGYLGFDVAILRGGALGRPIPTHALLTQGVSDANLATVGDKLTGPEADLADLRDQIDERPDAAGIYAAAANELGNDWDALYDELTRSPPANRTPGERFFIAAAAYISSTEPLASDREARVVEALRAALAKSAPPAP